MDLKIPYRVVKDAQGAFDIISRFIKDDGLTSSLPVTPEVNIDEFGKKIKVTASGFTMEAAFLADYMGIKLELGFIYSAFRGKILDTVEQKLKNLL
jgi:hypothetical protein